jgi:ABC-type sugar transport system ATPase subunit
MAAPETDLPPVLRLEAVRFSDHGEKGTFDLELSRGEIRHLRIFAAALQILGIVAPVSGAISVNGKRWEERSVIDRERQLRRIGTVHHPRDPSSSVWVGNLDIDENVRLAAHFDPARTSTSLERQADALARRFGLAEGLPTTRPAVTPLAEQVLSQWVRAFLPDPLDLLLLESPLEGAPPESIPALVAEIERVRNAGCSVLWISETVPDFAALGIHEEPADAPNTPT